MTIDWIRLTIGEIDRANLVFSDIVNDPTLSDAGKRQKLARFRDPLVASAQSSAASWLKTLTLQATRAEQALQLARHDAAVSINHDRRMYHRTRVREALEYGRWEDVAERLDGDLVAGDVDALSQWADLWPAVDRAFPDSAGGAHTIAQTGKVAHWVALKQAVASAEPEDVRQAESAVQAAATALFEARSRLDLANLAASMRGETPPFAAILNPPGETVQVGGPDDPDGQWIITTTGTGVFG